MTHAVDVLEHLRLAYHAAARSWALIRAYAPHLMNKVTVEDLNQAALLGLCRAAYYYRPELGFRFSTYAVRCIRGELADLFAKTKDAARVWETESFAVKDRIPASELACMLSEEDLADLAVVDARVELEDLFEVLTPRMREIVERRHGLFGRPAQSMTGMAVEFGLSRERVRQIYNQAIARMKAKAREEPGA